ncbi:MAG: glycoside hydrolase domain-containing protein [Victivallaceae bacterium]
MKLKKAGWLLLGGLLGYSAFAADKLNEKVLFDFSNKEQLKEWNAAQGAEISWNSEGSVNPGSMLLKTPAYSNKENQWPAAITVKIPENWSNYDELRLDVYPESGICAEFPILVKSGKGNYFEKPSLDWQGQWGTVTYRINHKKLNDADIKSLTIYQSHPSAAYAFRIDNIRLVNTLQEQLSELKNDYQTIGDESSINAIARLIADFQANRISPADARTQYQILKNKVRDASLNYLRNSSEKIYGNKNFAVAIADSATRVLPQAKAVIAQVPDKITVSLAQGEYEAVQPIVIAPTNKALSSVSVTIAALTLDGKTSVKFPEKCISSSPVGYVKTVATSRIVDYTGWYPDPILSFLKQVDVKAGETQPFWIRFFAGKNITPGIYTGKIIVATQNAGSVEIPLEVKVRNFAIPKRGHLKVATSVYKHKTLLHKNQLDGVYDFVMDKYRINPFNIYSSNAYGEPQLPKIEEYQRLVPMGLNFIPLLYLKLPRQAMHEGLTPSQSKAKWSAMSPDEQKQYPEEWKKRFIDILKKRIPELKKAGLYDMAYCYGFDEANTSEWPACAELCKEIKAQFPDIKIISTAGDSSYGQRSVLGEALTGFIPLDAAYNNKQADEARKNGKEVWWYSTQMTIDADTLSSTRNLLGKNSFDNNVDGFLVWTISRWNKNKSPIVKGPYTAWSPESYTGNNGGGSYFCPGPDGSFLPTLRAEAIRDGLEDYEYLYLLKQLSSKLSPDNPLAKTAVAILNTPTPANAADNRVYREQVGDLIEQILTQTKQ